METSTPQNSRKTNWTKTQEEIWKAQVDEVEWNNERNGFAALNGEQIDVLWTDHAAMFNHAARDKSKNSLVKRRPANKKRDGTGWTKYLWAYNGKFRNLII